MNTSKHTLAILDKVENSFSRYCPPRPVVSSIRIGAGLNDSYDFEVEVEIAPGATLAVRYQSVDEEGRQEDNLENEGGAVAWQVATNVEEFYTLGVDLLAERLHELHVQARQTFERWSARGTNVVLIDIQYITTEFWGLPDAPLVEMKVRSLNGRLRPAIFKVEVTTPAELDADLAG